MFTEPQGDEQGLSIPVYQHLWIRLLQIQFPNSTTKDASNGDDSGTGNNEQLNVFSQCAINFSRSADAFINLSKEEEEWMRVMMGARHSRDTRQHLNNARSLHNDVPPDDSVSKKPMDSFDMNSPSATSRAFANSLAAEEVKRKPKTEKV